MGGIRDPKKDGKATNKRYVDNVENVFVSPWKVIMAGNKLYGLSIPSKSDEAATKEYADRVGNDAREYVDRSTELLGRRFHGLPFAFLKANGTFVAYTPFCMASQPLRDLTDPK